MAVVFEYPALLIVCPVKLSVFNVLNVRLEVVKEDSVVVGAVNVLILTAGIVRVPVDTVPVLIAIARARLVSSIVVESTLVNVEAESVDAASVIVL